MINKEIREQLIQELGKTGNIYWSCSKIGIDRSTFYRWKNKDKKFQEKVEMAEKMGRENICDISEHALFKNVKAGNQRAIEYALRFNSERYVGKQPTNVFITYKKESSTSGQGVKTIEDLFDEYESRPEKPLE